MRQEGGEECEECPCLCRTPFSSLASRPPGAYKSQLCPPSLTQLFSPRRLSQILSSSDPRRPTSSRRQQPQPSRQPPTPPPGASRHQPPPRVRSSRAPRRLCIPLCVLPPRPDHDRLRRGSHQPRLGTPRPLHTGKLRDRRKGQWEGRVSCDCRLTALPFLSAACHGPGLQRAVSVRSRSGAELPRRREPGAGRLRLLPRLRQAAGRIVHGA